MPEPAPKAPAGAALLAGAGRRSRAPWLLAIGSLLVSLLLAEGLVRLLGAAPEVVLVRAGRFQLSSNLKLGYEPVASYQHEAGIDQFHDYVGRSNRLGFRDRDHAVAKPPGVTRILVLGDSVAAGQGVEHADDTFPPRLEALLRAEGLQVEVLNFAVAGYDTGQEVETLRSKGLAFQPDLVLLAYCLNDTRRDDGGVLASLSAQATSGAGLPGHRIHPVLAASALYRLLWHSYVRWSEDASSPTPLAAAADVRASFGELARLAAEQHFEVLVAVFPRFGGLNDDYRYLDQHQLPREASRANGFHYLDLLAAFQRCRAVSEVRLARDRYHPTAAGHECAARALRRYLLNHREELSLPPSS